MDKPKTPEEIANEIFANGCTDYEFRTHIPSAKRIYKNIVDAIASLTKERDEALVEAKKLKGFTLGGKITVMELIGAETRKLLKAGDAALSEVIRERDEARAEADFVHTEVYKEAVAEGIHDELNDLRVKCLEQKTELSEARAEVERLQETIKLIAMPKGAYLSRETCKSLAEAALNSKPGQP